ncbi:MULTISPECIES: hypothetical protein [Psychrobacter]|uniref:hypothetical protein n=1 Tax=Psychrobacter TaxID=497 RepID=UPI000EEAA682|nr:MULTISPECIES: hypothetical protein [Psychrobacter]HCH27021.1 hypothetical protein [Psychrobacter sp.]
MKITKSELLRRIEALEEWSSGADEMLTELNHALPDPEYDAKCEAQEADIDASLDRHRERLGLNKPKLKQLDQSVFDGQDEKWRFAAVDADGSARAYNYNQMPIGGNHEPHPDQSEKGFEAYEFIGTGYDASNWQNSIIERESKELTGSDLCRAMLERGDKYVLCFVSDFSDDHAVNQSKMINLVTHTKGNSIFAKSARWKYAVPINQQTGEPLTASEVGL